MADFRGIQQFVEYVNNYNTRDNDEDEATLNNLTDENYWVIKAIKRDNALRKFAEKSRIEKVKVAALYQEAIDHGFVKMITSEMNSHAIGECILVTRKGKELIEKRFRLPTGRWGAWIEYHDKKLIIVASLVSAGILGNLEHIYSALKNLWS